MTGPGAIMWGKVPVPYTAYWSSELPVKGWRIQRVEAFGRAPFLLETESNPGIGKPQLSTFHTGRAVEVLSKNLCQICREPLADGPIFCIGFGQVFEGRPHISDGLPMCRACTRLALEHCPSLRQSIGKTLRLYCVGSYSLAPAVMGIVDPVTPGADDRVNALLRSWHGQRPVFGCPKIMLKAFRQLDAEKFMKDDR